MVRSVLPGAKEGFHSAGEGRVLSLKNLLSDEPAWPLVREWISRAPNQVEVLDASEPERSQALEELQVTTRSPMGAVVYETGGLFIDGGWLRILGSGHPRLPRTLPAWNKARNCNQGDSSQALLLVADDAVGGSFAINGGAFDGPRGHVYYFAPDTLAWESLDRGYSDFLCWALSGDLATFYQAHRWPEWSEDASALAGDKGFSIYPFLWTRGPPVANRSRRVVPMAEIFEMQLDVRRELTSAGGHE